MNKRTLIIIALVAVAVTAGVVACNQHAKSNDAVADVTEVPVKLATATLQVVTDPVVTSGFVSSSSEARLSFKTGGVIQRIFVEEGDAVRKGQLLAMLNLTEINAMVEQAKQGLDKAQRDFDRAKNLYADTVATLEQFQNATTGLNVAKQQYEMAKFNQQYSEIRATDDGKIVKKIMNEGEIVSAGMPVFFMNASGANDWEVKAGIADKDWARLKPGNTAIIKIDAYPNDNFTGVVSALSQAPDPMSGLYEVKIKLKATGKPMATGLFAKAQVVPNSETQYVTIPVDAIIEGSGSDAFVYTVINNKAQKQPVRVAFIGNGKVMLSSGLEANTEVVTDGSAYLTDGTLVKVVKQD